MLLSAWRLFITASTKLWSKYRLEIMEIKQRAPFLAGYSVEIQIDLHQKLMSEKWVHLFRAEFQINADQILNNFVLLKYISRSHIIKK